MKGIQFVVDDKGERQAVLISLRHHRKLWEDFRDLIIAHEREREPSEPFDEVKRTVIGEMP